MKKLLFAIIILVGIALYAFKYSPEWKADREYFKSMPEQAGYHPQSRFHRYRQSLNYHEKEISKMRPSVKRNKLRVAFEKCTLEHEQDATYALVCYTALVNDIDVKLYERMIAREQFINDYERSKREE